MPLSEKALIRRIRSRVKGGSAIIHGIGDDCAVLRVPPGHELLVTTDLMLENVHFRRDWHRAEAVGRRTLTRGLSDIAAMGGEPRACFLSLALAGDVPQKWVDDFFRGLLGWTEKFRVPLAGGDTAESPQGIQIDIVVVGSAPQGTAILRSEAKPGDQIYVTGCLGASAASILQLQAGRPLRPGAQRLFQPTPRLDAGQWLRKRTMASAMIDTSDGLSTDLEHICQESHVGAEIEAAAIPRARAGSKRLPVALDLALHGGEDYELLFTSAKKVPARVAGVPVTRIGKITQRGMRIRDSEGVVRAFEARGWEHFQKKAYSPQSHRGTEKDEELKSRARLKK